MREKITEERLIEAIFRENSTGFCLCCGANQTGVEPDARKYACQACGVHQVYGAEEIGIMLLSGQLKGEAIV